MSEDVRELLRQHSLFRALSESDLDQLARVTGIRRYERGDNVFLEGDASNHFFSIVSGRAKVFKVTPSGQEIILEIFGANDPLGAVAAYEQRPYPASASALDDTVCIAIPTGPLLSLLAEYPSLVRGLLVGMTKRLVELTRRISELTGGRVEPRLARLFIKLVEEKGQPMPEGIAIPLPLSRQELADLTGTTIETCIRIMSRWGKEGLVRTEPDGFTVLQVDAMRALSET